MNFWIMCGTVDTMSDENSISSGSSSDDHFIEEGIQPYPVLRHNSLKSWKNFYGNFLPQLEYILIQFIFFVISNNLSILCFPLFLSCAYIFDFQLWHIIFIIHRCVTNNAEHRYLACDAIFRKASLKIWESNNTSTHKCNILFFLWRKLLTDT